MSETPQPHHQLSKLFETIQSPAQVIEPLEDPARRKLIDSLRARFVQQTYAGRMPLGNVLQVSDAFCEAHGITATSNEDGISPAAQYHSKYGKDFPLLVDQCRWAVSVGLFTIWQVESFKKHWGSVQ